MNEREVAGFFASIHQAVRHLALLLSNQVLLPSFFVQHYKSLSPLI